MKILELKNTTTKIKNSVDVPNHRMEITRRLVHLRMEQYKLPNLNNRRTSIWQKNEPLRVLQHNIK